MAPYFSKELSGELHGKRKEGIARAIEHYVITGQVEKIAQVCNTCLYRSFAAFGVSECSVCRVHLLKKKIVKLYAGKGKRCESPFQKEGPREKTFF